MIEALLAKKQSCPRKTQFPLKGVLGVKGVLGPRARARQGLQIEAFYARGRGPRTPFTPRTFFKGNCVHSSIVRFDLVNLRLRLLKFLLVYLLVSKDNGLGALRRR